ncbi:YciI family protein [Albimonas sp. CAU 1670]|uniref:YciI family protein n=1 Tax=Albimonas sp. CAU 1670 TaxID=3032599 RepID=UPI0023DC9B07|nr:YciI family protein [Albimonas sp. CAU 1670]MDF2231573.1 YciI family protein [Albimonas sp. CAU 1670]
MQYMLMIYHEEGGWDRLTPAQQAEGMAAYRAYAEALTAAGALVGSERLQPTATATTVRVADGETRVLDGPYAETKEQFGGYYIVEAADLDAALDWAARCPGARHGVVEVRPLWTMG